MPFCIYTYMQHAPKATSYAHRIVGGILSDLTDRKGLRQEFEQFDSDIHYEIIKEWERITAEVLDTIPQDNKGEM